METIQAAIDYNQERINDLKDDIQYFNDNPSSFAPLRVNECLETIRFYQINIEALKQAQLKLN